MGHGAGAGRTSTRPALHQGRGALTKALRTAMSQAQSSIKLYQCARLATANYFYCSQAFVFSRLLEHTREILEDQL